jgi:hypothetical protein
MKNLIILLLLVPLSSFSQEEKTETSYGFNINYGSKLSYRWNSYDLGASFSPLFTITRNKRHQFEIGPQLFFFDDQFKTKVGVMENYVFYPNGYSNRFNSSLFVSLEVLYFKEKNLETIYFNGAPQLLYDIDKFGFFRTKIGIGYGLNFKIARGLYLGSRIMGTLTYAEQHWEQSSTVESPYPLNRLRYVSLSITGNMSIGYRF